MQAAFASGELPPVQFETRRYLSAPPAVVFALISDNATLPTPEPGPGRVQADEARSTLPRGAGTRRTLDPLMGIAGTEGVVAFEPPFGLSYSATDESLRGLLTAHVSELQCAAYGEGTELSWTVRGRLARSWWKRLLARLLFARALRSGVKDLERRLAT
ncbi:MAG TPA: SRPBCC family protein [Polyangiaceae bacterium]|nr:SRPBCC family protein [Polyangiaceae bacterium]